MFISENYFTSAIMQETAVNDTESNDSRFEIKHSQISLQETISSTTSLNHKKAKGVFKVLIGAVQINDSTLDVHPGPREGLDKKTHKLAIIALTSMGILLVILLLIALLIGA